MLGLGEEVPRLLAGEKPLAAGANGKEHCCCWGPLPACWGLAPG